MFDNSLQDVQFTGEYYEEYLSHIDRYKNLMRPSVFCRYLKVNKDASIFHKDIEGTHDRYYSGIRYDSYEYTPTYMTPQKVSRSGDDQEKIGQRFSSGPLEMTIYTIEKPSINDLVVFPYGPNNSETCYRVSEISIHKNAIKDNIHHSNITVTEAPVDHNKLSYLNSYVYLMTQEQYVPTKKYVRIIDEYKKFIEIFKILEKQFDPKSELYYYNYNNMKISPLKQNQIIYEFLTNRRHNTRYFTHTKIPFGIKNINYPIGDSSGYDISTQRKIEMGNDNNPIILGWEEFLNNALFPSIPFHIEYYYFIDGRPTYGDKLPPEYTENIIKYEINESTLLMDIGALIPCFKG
jgi:hypothetical protein